MLDESGSTSENLHTAITGETYEYTEIYLPMLKKKDIRLNLCGHFSLDSQGLLLEVTASVRQGNAFTAMVAM